MAYEKSEPSAPHAALTAEGRYTSLDQYRQPYLARAREAAKLTIPSLLPPDGNNGSSVLPQAFQSVGAKGLLNLASKLLLALFPPGAAFFRLTVDAKVKASLKAAAQGDADPLAEVEAALAESENVISDRIEQEGSRIDLDAGLQQILCSGNVLLQILPKGGLLAHRLDRYVVKRDPEKNPIDIVLKQSFARVTLPEVARVIVEQHGPKMGDYNSSAYNTIDVYTRICRKDRFWLEYQEVCGIEIPGTRSTYPLDASPWLPLAFDLIPGEDYGRGFVERYIGDLYSLDSLRQSIVEFAAAASKIVWLVNESGVTDKAKLARAPSNAVMDGNREDIGVLMLEKTQDFQVAHATAEAIEKSLGEAFLLGSAARRDAERVTAEEIRLIAGELEQALGGVYSVLTQELQLPLVKRLMLIEQRAGRLPPLPKQVVKPQIVTGLAALGRNADLQKLDHLVVGIAEVFGPEGVNEYISAGGYAKRRATALGIDTEGLVRSEADVAARREQQQRQALVEKLGPHAIKAQADAQASASAPAA